MAARAGGKHRGLSQAEAVNGAGEQRDSSWVLLNAEGETEVFLDGQRPPWSGLQALPAQLG